MASPSLSFKSRTRVRVLTILHRWIFVILFALILTTAISGAVEISYTDHCGAAIPEAKPTDRLPAENASSLHLSAGSVSGGAPLLESSPFSIPRSFLFLPQSFYRTLTPGVFRIEATVSVRDGAAGPYLVPRRNLSSMHRVRPRIPRSFPRRGHATFDFSGYFHEPSGLICMVGVGSAWSKGGTSFQLSAVFNLHYPTKTNIFSSLITGKLESLDAADSLNHFYPISILAYTQKNYEYTKISEAKDSCSRASLRENSLALDNTRFCFKLKKYLRGLYRLEYGRNCSSNGNCGPFQGSLGSFLSFFSFNQMQCSEDGSVHMYIGFSNITSYFHGTELSPEMSLVAEGSWDRERNKLCLVACHLMSNASVGDCTIGFSVWFPAALTLESRKTVVGRIWSNKRTDDPGYFERVSFQSVQTGLMVPGLKYNYTKTDTAMSSCVNGTARRLEGKSYPYGKSFSDMRFDLSVTDAKGLNYWGYANPFSVDEVVYGDTFMMYSKTSAAEGLLSLAEANKTLFNVSYLIAYHPWASASSNLRVQNFNASIEISAEGVYNSARGMLCMVGCRRPTSSMSNKPVKEVESIDCGVIINIQLPPSKPEAGDHLSGTIRSTRGKSDPLYFEPLQLYSSIMYQGQAVELVRRMDIEITMVLISLTLSCLFVGFQLFYVRRHPDVLPSVSFAMLVILTFGHMIPLVLNFEALFFISRNKQNVLLWSGGWLEVNEVIVRVMTMIAFLLQFRFLQVAWSARCSDDRLKGFWVAEREALQLCLPLYFAGALIAWFFQSRSYGTNSRHMGISLGSHPSFWEDLICYAGLILDGFLLPQILLNILSNSKNKALSPIFYIGTTVVRAMPHLYDAYRARHYLPHTNSSYIYASPDGDFYSFALDIIVPCVGVLFTLLIYLQQRFGGSCILPTKLRRSAGYETVSAVSL